MMKSRLSTDLKDPRLMRLLKLEAQETGTSVTNTLRRALEAYFAHRLETKALLRISENTFEEWSDPRDSDYDVL
ncbi:MAG: hypothetical protein HY537_13280 [Deltaproteobacteria bacterium]|nr:hypothetical protein [Deltaproteobacteria bacterium]